MTTRMYCLLAVLGMGLSFGCNQKGEPPPEFNMAMNEGGMKLLPIRLVTRDKTNLIAAAATGETAAAPAGGGGSSAAATAAVAIDDSTADAFAKSMAAVLKAGSFAQLPDLVLPDQKEQIQQMVTASLPLMEARAELKKALDEKFAGHAIQIPGGTDALGRLFHEASITDVKAEDDNAEGTLHFQDASGEQTVSLIFKRADGKWRLDDSSILEQVPSADEISKAGERASKLAEALRGVIKKVNDGEVADVDAAQKELMRAGMRLTIDSAQGAGDAAGGENATPPAGESATPAPAEENAAQPAPQGPTGRPGRPILRGARPRQRDEVDGTYSGPGMLRQK